MAGKRKVRVHKPCYECGGNTYKQGGDWMQKATDSIERRGTEGRCTGSNFGGPDCPPGSKQYNLAQTFRKMSKKKKGGSSALQNDNIDKIGEDKINVFKNFLAENTTNTMVEETLIDGPMPTGGMETTFNNGGQNNFGFNPNPAYMDDYIAKVNELNQLNSERANAFRIGLENTDFNKRLKMKTKLTKAGEDWYRNNYKQFGGNMFPEGGQTVRPNAAEALGLIDQYGTETTDEIEIPSFNNLSEYRDWLNINYPEGHPDRERAINKFKNPNKEDTEDTTAEDTTAEDVDPKSGYIEGPNGEMINVTSEEFNEYLNNPNLGNPNLGYKEPGFLQNGKQTPSTPTQQTTTTTTADGTTPADDETALDKVDKAVNKTKGNVDVKTLKGEQEADASTEKEKQELAHFTARTPGLFGGKETFAYNPNLTGMSEMNFRRAMLPGNRLKNIKFAHYGPGQQPNAQNTQRQNPNANTTSQQQWDPNAPDFDWERAAMFANRFNTGKERAPVPDAMPRKNDVQIPVTKPTPGQIPANKMRPVAPMPDTNTNAEGMAMRPTPQLSMQRSQPNGVQGPYGQVNSLEDLQYQKDLQAGRVGSASADESGGYVYGGIPNNLPKAEMGNLGKGLLIGAGVLGAGAIGATAAPAIVGGLAARKGIKQGQKGLGQLQDMGQNVMGQSQNMFGQAQGMANPIGNMFGQKPSQPMMSQYGGVPFNEAYPQAVEFPVNQYGGVPFQEAYPQAVKYPVEQYAFGGAGKERRQIRKAERQEKRANRKALRPWNLGDTLMDQAADDVQQFNQMNTDFLNTQNQQVQGMNPMGMVSGMMNSGASIPNSQTPHPQGTQPDPNKEQGFDPSAIMSMFGNKQYGGKNYADGGGFNPAMLPQNQGMMSNQYQPGGSTQGGSMYDSWQQAREVAAMNPAWRPWHEASKMIPGGWGDPAGKLIQKIESKNQMAQYGGMPKMQYAGQPLAETTVRQGYDAGQFQPIISGGMDMAASVGTAMTEGDTEQDMMNLTSAENVFTPNTNPSKGTTTFNPVGVDSAPDQYTPVQFGAYGGQFKKGGSYTMSDNEIKQFLAAGGQIEYLD